MSHVITITGPSRAGKSTAIRYLLACEDENFKPKLVRKYTTRSLRTDDRDDEVRCVPEVPDRCDLVYEQYGVRYGLELHTIFDHIAEGQSPIVVLNDVRAVEDVRDSLGELVRSIFVFRKDPSSLQYRKELVNSRGVEDAEPRYERAQTIFRIYIENIHLFDHVVVNSGSFEELEIQVRQIVKGLRNPNWPLRERR
jgi:guanylate kinase